MTQQKDNVEQTNQAPQVVYMVTKENLLTAFTDAIKGFVANKEKESDEQVLIDIDDVCAMLNVSRSTLWRWNKEGVLKQINIGSKVRYKLSDVKRFGRLKGYNID